MIIAELTRNLEIVHPRKLIPCHKATAAIDIRLIHQAKLLWSRPVGWNYPHQQPTIITKVKVKRLGIFTRPAITSRAWPIWPPCAKNGTPPHFML
jgi:hypothetical protein